MAVTPKKNVFKITQEFIGSQDPDRFAKVFFSNLLIDAVPSVDDLVLEADREDDYFNVTVNVL